MTQYRVWATVDFNTGCYRKFHASPQCAALANVEKYMVSDLVISDEPGPDGSSDMGWVCARCIRVLVPIPEKTTAELRQEHAPRLREIERELEQ
jgi:hypothetical protein